jgi:hypothetical protein
MGKKHSVKISSDISISSNRTPKIQVSPESYYALSPSWSFSRCDLEHPKWSLYTVDIFADIIPKLISLERRTWGDIVNAKKQNHPVECRGLIKEAQQRLLEIKLYTDTLFSLRLDGTMRLYGYIESGVFFIVWCDPNHEIFPSYLKHT